MRNPRATIRKIAENRGKTPAQIALRWLVEQEKVAAVPKAGSPAHRAGNLENFDLELSSEETDEVSSLVCGERRIHPPSAPDRDR